MVRKRYTEEPIIAVLNEAEAGARTTDLCRTWHERCHFLQLEGQVRGPEWTVGNTTFEMWMGAVILPLARQL